MKKMAFLLMAGAALLGATGASAQTDASVTASITIPRVLSMSVNSNTVTFNPPTAGDYNASGAATLTTTDQTVISTRGNVFHDIEVLATTPSFGFTATAESEDPAVDPGKSAGDLEWSADAGATWAPLDDVLLGDVVSNLGRGVNAAAATVRYRLQSTLADDPPGVYTLTFVYSVVPN